MLLTIIKVRHRDRGRLVEQHRAEAAPERTGVGQQSIGSAGLINTGFVGFLHT